MGTPSAIEAAVTPRLPGRQQEQDELYGSRREVGELRGEREQPERRCRAPAALAVQMA
jgi:hypothetical protein